MRLVTAISTHGLPLWVCVTLALTQNVFAQQVVAPTTTQAPAQNSLLLLGAGGEPPGESTIFDFGFSILGDKLTGSGWRYSIAFDGGHAKTEEIARLKFANADERTEFKPQDFDRALAQTIQKIQNGTIAANGQLLVIVDTHGAGPSSKNLSHEVSASGGQATNLTTLSGSQTVSLDRLQDLISSAQAKGIKVGIIDMSCHSGNSLKLKAPGTCVISASGPNHYAYSSFAAAFYGNLKRGVSLEDVFLKTRAEIADSSYPMISTDAHARVADQFYGSLTPYLYTNDGKNNKFSDYALTNHSPNALCEREQSFDALISKIQELQKTAPSAPRDDLGSLEALLKRYKTIQDEALKAIQTLGTERLKTQESFGDPKKPEFTWTWNEILLAQPDQLLEIARADYKKYRSAEVKANGAARIAALEQLKQRRAELLQRYPELAEHEQRQKLIFAKIEESRNLASEISREERKLYSRLYARETREANSIDPCRQIKF